MSLVFENNLDQLIKRSGLTKRAVALKLGITSENLSRAVHGKTKLNLARIEEYSKILDCHPAEIIFAGQQINVIGGWWVSDKDLCFPILKSYKRTNLNRGEHWKGATLKLNSKNFLLTGRYVGIANFNVPQNHSLPLGEPGTLSLINIDGVEEAKFNQEDIGKFCVASITNQTLVAGEMYPKPNGEFEFWLPEISQTQVFSEIHWARSISSMQFGYDFSTLDESKFVGASNLADLERPSSTKKVKKIVSQQSQGVDRSLVGAPVKPDLSSSIEKKILLTMREACVLLFGEWNDNLQRRLRRLIDSGEIDAVKDGKKFHIPRSEINRLEGNR